MSANRFIAAALALFVAGALQAADKAAQPGAQIAQPPSQAVDLATCTKLLDSIDASEKEIAFYRFGGVLDNSAPRETMRLLNKLSEQQRQSQNLSMMIAMRCPNLPVGMLGDGDAYFSSALECHQPSPGMTTKEACDRKRWTPKDRPGGGRL